LKNCWHGPPGIEPTALELSLVKLASILHQFSSS